MENKFSSPSKWINASKRQEINNQELMKSGKTLYTSSSIPITNPAVYFHLATIPAVKRRNEENSIIPSVTIIHRISSYLHGHIFAEIEAEDSQYRKRHRSRKTKKLKESKKENAIRILKEAIGKPHSIDCPKRKVLNLIHNMEIGGSKTTLDAALDVYDDACDNFGGQQNPRTVYARVLLGEAYLQTGEVNDAHKHLRWALQVLYYLRKSFHDGDQNDCPIFLTLLCIICTTNLARIYGSIEDALRSSKFYKLSIELIDDEFKDMEPELGRHLQQTCQYELAFLYKTYGCFPQSLYYFQACACNTKTINLSMSVLICEVLARLHRFSECLELSEKGLEVINSKNEMRKTKLHAQFLFFMSICLHMEMQVDRAISILNNAIDIQVHNSDLVTPAENAQQSTMGKVVQSIDELINVSRHVRIRELVDNELIFITSWYCQLGQFYVTKSRVKDNKEYLVDALKRMRYALAFFLENSELIDINCVPILLQIGDLILNQDQINPIISVVYYDLAASICKATLTTHSPYRLYCEQTRAYARYQIGMIMEGKSIFVETKHQFKDILQSNNNHFTVMAAVYFQMTFAACVLRNENNFKGAYHLCASTLKKYVSIFGYDGASVANMCEEIGQYGLLSAIQMSNTSQSRQLLLDNDLANTLMECVDLGTLPMFAFESHIQNDDPMIYFRLARNYFTIALTTIKRNFPSEYVVIASIQVKICVVDYFEHVLHGVPYGSTLDIIKKVKALLLKHESTGTSCARWIMTPFQEKLQKHINCITARIKRSLKKSSH